MTAATEFEPVIGLEVHVQLATLSKAFCGAQAEFGGPPNTHIDPYTLGLPGALPVLNHRAVEFALRMGLACGCDIALRSELSRKHYFYPDSPKGYQISQFDRPICENGHIEFVLGSERRQVRLLRIHIEEDAGKNLHLLGGRTSTRDFTRDGVPLSEVVPQPEVRPAADAGEWRRSIRQLARFAATPPSRFVRAARRSWASVQS